MWDKAFRGSLTLVPAGYIGPADTTLTSDFPLGAGRFVIQTVAHGDDHPLPGRQAGMDTLPDLDAGISSIQVLQHVVVHRNHIHKRQRPSIPRRLQSLCEGYLPLKLPLGPEMHQNLILNAPAGVGGQAHIFIRLECGDPLDQSNRANGN